MKTITFTDEDLMRMSGIEIDRDSEEALRFILERIVPEIKRQDGLKLRSHLDGGKGTAL